MAVPPDRLDRGAHHSRDEAVFTDGRTRMKHGGAV